MAYKLKIYFSDGSYEVDPEDYDSKEDAEAAYDEWLDSWSEGGETLALAGEDHSDAEIEDYEIFRE